MKIKIVNTYINTADISIIGPVETHRGDGSTGGYSCTINLRGQHHPYYVTLTNHKVDPYSLDQSGSDKARDEANANYSALVDAWSSIPPVRFTTTSST